MQPDIDGTLRLATVFYPFLSIRFHFQQQSHTDGATVWPAPAASNFVFSLQNHQIATLSLFPTAAVVLLSGCQSRRRQPCAELGQSVRCTWLFEKQVSRGWGWGDVPGIGLAVLTLIRLKLKLKWSDLS